MKEKILGILIILFAALVIGNVLLIVSQGIAFDSLYLQLLAINTSVLISTCGIYLTKRYASSSLLTEKTIIFFGLALIIFTGLASFNILPWLNSWNWLIAAVITFITMVQMQIINWDKSKGLIKLLGLLTVLSNLFAVALLAFKLSSTSLGIVFDIAIVVSISAFIVALAFHSKKAA